MSNNDKFIRDTPHGKLMESQDQYSCTKCKYYKFDDCFEMTNEKCFDNLKSYFAKDETDETEKHD